MPAELLKRQRRRRMDCSAVADVSLFCPEIVEDWEYLAEWQSLPPLEDRMSDGRPTLAVTGLVQEHAEFLFRYAYRLSGSVQDAEDLTQQTFLAAYRSLDQLREAERARAWLAAILRNAYRRSFRNTAAGSVVPLDSVPEPVQEPEADGAVDPEVLQSALAELPEEYRSVLILFYLEHLGYRQIADALEIPIGTVMSRLSRGKAHLRRRLLPEAAVVTAGRAAPSADE